MTERLEIKKMPPKELLEEFLMGMFGMVTVIFDIEKGEFIKTKQEPKKEVESDDSGKR